MLSPVKSRASSPRRIAAAVVLASVTAFTAACGSGSDDAASDSAATSTLRFGYVGGDTEFPPDEFGWGLSTGLVQNTLAEHGIDSVEWTGFGTGPDLNESVLAGRIDVTSSGDTPALTARSAGGPTRLLSAPSGFDSIIVTTTSGPTDLAGLAGRKIAVVKGSTMHQYLVGALNDANVDAEIININSTADSLAAAERGEVDAVATVPYLQVVNASLDSGFKVIDSAANHEGLGSLRVSTVTDDFLQGHSDVPQAYADARAAVIAQIDENPAAYYDWLAELTGSPREDVERLYPRSAINTESLNSGALEQLDRIKSFLVEEGLLRGDFDVDEWAVQS